MSTAPCRSWPRSPPAAVGDLGLHDGVERVGDGQGDRRSTSTRSERPSPRRPAPRAGRERVPRSGQRLHVGGERGQRHRREVGVGAEVEDLRRRHRLLRRVSGVHHDDAGRRCAGPGRAARGRRRGCRRRPRPGVSTAVGGDPVRRAERVGERRQPAGGRGGEQHQLGRRLGDHVVVAARRRRGSGGSGGIAGGLGGGGGLGRGERSWGLDSVGVLLCTLTLRPQCEAPVWTA